MYGVRGTTIEWFSSYLNNRYQYVVYNDCKSECKKIQCGVPQGSVLGPLLFLIFINDLPSVSKLFMPILFADDTNLFCTGDNLDLLVDRINVEMTNVYAWVKANKLSLNVDKTNFMLFTPKHRSRSIKDILIDNCKINEVKETKFLGVVIDNALKWSSHLEYISGKVAKGIGVIIKARKIFSAVTLLSLYNSLIMPYLSYCIHVWGKAYDTHLRHLMSLQNKVVRIIAGVPPRTHVESLYADLNIMPLKKMYLYTVGLFMYKFNNDMLPEMFVDMFAHVSTIHDRNTRQSARNHLYVALYTTSRSQKCISYTGPRTWNFILSKINPHAPIGSFKNNLRALFNECSLLNILLWYCVTMWSPCSIVPSYM